MSLSSKKSALAVRSRASFDSLKESLFEWGYEWKNGKLIDLGGGDDRSLSEWDLEKIKTHNLTDEQMRDLLKNKSRGAKYIAWRFRKSTYNDGFPSIEEVCSDWAALKDIRRWMSQQNPEDLFMMSLATKTWQQAGWSYYNDISRYHEEGYYYTFEPHKLLYLGIRFAWQAERFCKLWKEVCNSRRPWGSCYQPSQGKAKALALTPNFNRLPMWVKSDLIKYAEWIETDRVGNVWDLIPCVKAWKYCPELPKAIAKRIGQMPAWKRLEAKAAWESLETYYTHSLSYYRKNEWQVYRGDGYETVTRSELINKFWTEFNHRCSAYNPVRLLDDIAALNNASRHYKARLVESVLGLPHKYLSDGFDPSKLPEYYKLADQDALLKGLFGTNAKSVKEAWSNCKPDQMRWSIALAPKGNPDVVVKFLSAPCVVAYQKDAVNFVASLGDWKPRLRMIANTTYRVRGEEKMVEDFLVKDTGMLFNNLVNQEQGEAPDLGRVRCWLSTHEELGRRYIGTLPNTPVIIPSDWERVNGLSSVDGKWSIQLPTSTAQLKYWGEQLHNCVGGYGESINRGRCVVFVVYVDGILSYCVEIQGKDCNQFLGVRNSSANSAIKQSVLRALHQAQLVSCS